MKLYLTRKIKIKLIYHIFPSLNIVLFNFQILVNKIRKNGTSIPLPSQIVASTDKISGNESKIKYATSGLYATPFMVDKKDTISYKVSRLKEIRSFHQHIMIKKNIFKTLIWKNLRQDCISFCVTFTLNKVFNFDKEFFF